MYFLIYFFIIGMVLGSFFCVVGIRVPRSNFFEKNRSYCPHCHHSLVWHELLPIISYISQNGKCKHCKQPISPIYPFIELSTGVLFAYSYYYFGFSSELVVSLLFISLLAIIVVTDLEYMLIPNKILLFFLPFFLLLRLIFPVEPWYDPLIGGAIGYLLIAVIILASNGGMGAGDMKLMGVAGIVIGWKGVLLTIFIASLVGGLIGLLLLLFRLRKRKQSMPFGPYIALGALISYFFGDELILWYFESYLFY